MIDLTALSDELELREGIWFSRRQAVVSYPPRGNQDCLAIEDASFWFRHRNRCLVELARRFAPGGALLDIGAGNGFVARALESAGFPTIALEPGPDGAAAARARGLPTVVCATLQDAGFRRQSVAAAGLFDVLEHIEDDHGFLLQVRETLRPGGRLYLTVPAYEVLWSAEDDHAGHFRRYRRTTLSRLLRAAGFRVEWSSFMFAPLVLPLFALRSLPSWLGIRRVSVERSGREHRPGRGLAGPLEALLDGEFHRLAAGRPVPFGTSCVAVASRVD